MDEVIQNIAEYIRNSISSPQTYTYKRPSKVDSIVVIPSTQNPANVKMWSQDTYVTVMVYSKASPQSSYTKVMDIRDLLLEAQGVLVTDGVKFLGFYAESPLPSVVDVAEDDNEIYGMSFKVKYIDNTIPT